MAERKRQLNQVGGRPVKKFLSLTEAEYAELSAAANREGKTLQRFVVEAGIARVREVDPDQVRETITALFGVQHQLAKIGNNVNQIARHANATGGEILREELDGEVKALRTALVAVNETVEMVSLEGRRA